MAELLEELPLSPEIGSAILDFEGPAGRILERVVTREQQPPDVSPAEQEELTEAWLDAVEWADEAERPTIPAGEVREPLPPAPERRHQPCRSRRSPDIPLRSL